MAATKDTWKWLDCDVFYYNLETYKRRSNAVTYFRITRLFQVKVRADKQLFLRRKRQLLDPSWSRVCGRVTETGRKKHAQNDWQDCVSSRTSRLYVWRLRIAPQRRVWVSQIKTTQECVHTFWFNVPKTQAKLSLRGVARTCGRFPYYFLWPQKTLRRGRT